MAQHQACHENAQGRRRDGGEVKEKRGSGRQSSNESQHAFAKYRLREVSVGSVESMLRPFGSRRPRRQLGKAGVSVAVVRKRRFQHEARGL